MTPMQLRGATVAITGGARGIGLATAKAFAAQGALVWIGDIDAAAAQRAAAEIGGKGYELDVRSRKSFTAFLAAIEGPLDILVNNAGIMPMGRFADEDDLVTDAILDINVKGVLTGTKLALPGMLDRRRGHIVNVASYLGEVPAAGLASYCASKHAVIGFSESLRDELHGTGVTVTAVLPSAVRTDLVAGVQLGGVLPTVDPERIAAAVVASCAHRRTLVAVPGWMRAYELAAALLPDRLLAAVRGHLTRDRVLQRLDTAARDAYDARVRRDSAARS
ncbi:SDR family oxidoreductase [Nocardia sp. NPDC005825]|uniref:SDR family oxidoreductase n=1 Tax=unclassified Nocardia TaxID=2637762 RepID=UPI0033FEDF6B